MGVDTKLRLNGRVEPESILLWVKTFIDPNAVLLTRKTVYEDSIITRWKTQGLIKESYGEDPPFYTFSQIFFTLNGKSNTLSIHYTNINVWENLEIYKAEGLERMVKSETTDLSIYYSKDNLKFCTDLIKDFGGWIDYNDCDEEPFVYIGKGMVAPQKIRHVTMEDVYKAFGEIVIIDNI